MYIVPTQCEIADSCEWRHTGNRAGVLLSSEFESVTQKSSTELIRGKHFLAFCAFCAQQVNSKYSLADLLRQAQTLLFIIMMAQDVFMNDLSR